MKLTIAFFFSIFYLTEAYGQSTATDTQFIDLRKIVQKNISSDENQYSNNFSEYFLIDIKLNDTGDSITNIDFFRKNNSVHYQHIENLVKRIKSNWRPIKCQYTRLIIPLFLLFSSAENLQDYPIPFYKKVDTNFSSKTYILDEIVIRIHTAIK